jgi:hypothetical protein
MTTVPLQTVVLRSDIDLPFEQRRARQGRQQLQSRARQPIAKLETVPRPSKLTDKQAATTV